MGELVAGRYAKIRELGRGGMGVVWLAEDRVIGRQVALKELRTSSRTDIERVLREARTAGRLNSPNVVGIHDVLVEDGVTYLVMELVEAPTLADVMAREGALSEDRVRDIGLQVLNALEAAHAAGIVHRDVKPSNIMVLPDGRVKLADFGIARAMDDPSLTATGGIMGSPGYMAPELFSGDAPAPASDLWALGATMFHAVEGRSPFTRETTAATMHAIMYERPALSRTGGSFASVIMGLLAQSPDQRLTAQQLREHLTDGTRRVEPATVYIEPVTSVVATSEPPKSRKKIGVIAGAVAAVVVIGLAGVFLIKPASEPGSAAAQAGAATSSSAGESSAPASTSVSSAASSSSSSAAPSSSASTGPKPTQQQSNAPAPTTTKPKPALQTLPFSRYRNGNGWHYSGTSRIAVPDGFTVENTGGLGMLLANPEPGTKPLYSCRINNSEDRMTSAAADCEGQTPYGGGPLGYVFTSEPAGVPSMVLYRCNMGAHHFDSVAGCEGYQTEFPFGWVVR
ncbi:hypothetical protein Lesp02_34830 [Lentzea sp. NBRC 105346]|uniref:serine/threonine-protein kinase n=1 Tax=Lentzea sp. NBRC 105346 TaxID=3032205 RepID=UPI0024A4DAAF|nr:serine/threonine-protein kinase [Lentzea sp. NBRC 105346]GLZ31295.1 hypothetical protein Lesp02_34830 [Lentzea sp. NBRC 105346]